MPDAKAAAPSLLLFGASGQLGTAVLRAWGGQSRVYTVSRRPPSTNLTAATAESIDHVAADLLDPEQVARVAERGKDAQACVLLASHIHTGSDVRDLPSQAQLEITAPLTILGRLERLSQIVYASSYTVYGVDRTSPASEQDQLDPANVYAATKVAAERFLAAFARRQGIPLTILRIAQVYGAGSQSAEIVTRLCREVRNRQRPIVNVGEKPFRDYVHEDDVARAVVHALERRVEGTFNIGGGEPVAIADLARWACAAGGLDAGPVISREATTWSLALDISRAKAELAFAPRESPRSFIASCVAQGTR